MENVIQQNEICNSIVNRAINKDEFLGESFKTTMEFKYTEEDLNQELEKYGYNFESLDLLYFFDLMISKNVRFLIKEPITNMFFDNIFIHNEGIYSIASLTSEIIHSLIINERYILIIYLSENLSLISSKIISD